ncbi:hypothetical protein LAZ67_X002714 [Cordylochernes scorpioides]|uniref:Uncharacterized protein n=1 Tax=Cordylochernes scorpioides TaxID=51811 RepID=A0ABY6LW73_9ARAC|nr:hypothetical protein LAZ67_X002714 [Cordylochernes scorpioides]
MRPYSISLENIKEACLHIARMKARDTKNVVPEIIIRGNKPNLILTRELASGPPDAPVGWRTPLGWTIAGEFDNVMEKTLGSVNYSASKSGSDRCLHALIKSSFSHENIGVVATKFEGVRKREKGVYGILQKTTKKVNGRWETGLLWREDEISLPDIYNMALGRLRSDPEMKVNFSAKFREYSEKAYVRKLSKDDIAAGNARTWYVPHFGVTNPNKLRKLRLVFDAAAE